jgi:hypothetical protein
MKEKLLHFAAGIAVAILAGIFTYWTAKIYSQSLEIFWINKFQLVLSSVFFGLIAGIAKEAYDYVLIKKGKKLESSFSLSDIKWTIYGSLVGGLLFWLIAITVANDYYKEPKTPRLDTLEGWQKGIDEIHRNDPVSFDDESKNLIERSDSLLLKLQ